MTALFRTRRRAEEFAAALEDHPSRVSSELQQLVGVAAALRSSPHDTEARPRADFTAELRSRLMAEAERTLTPGGASLALPVRQRGARERRLVAAASAVVLLGGSAGMAAAAQHSLPGEALYPIKRGLERAQAELSVSSAGKGQDLLEQANDRLTEVETLLAGDSLTSGPRVPQTISDFTAAAQEGARLLMASFEETGDPDDIVAVREFTANGINLLRDLARTAPPEAQDELAAAALALGQIDQQASALCDTCADQLPDLEVPGMFLAAAEADRALTVVTGRPLDNSHPFVIDKVTTVQPETSLLDLTPASGRPSTEGETDADADEQSAEEPSGDSSAPSSPGLGLPDGDTDASTGGGSDVTTDVTKKVTEGTKKAVDDTVGDITDGLSGVVETVLPDPFATP